MRISLFPSVVISVVLFGVGCGGEAPVPPPERPQARQAPTTELIKPPAPRITAEELRRQLGANSRAEFIEEDGGIHTVVLADSGVTDISALKGLELRQLSLAGLPITDLSPLAGMPLEALDLGDTPVRDLSPLRGLPIKRLYLAGTAVSDLSSLAGMSLDQLNLMGTPVEDLSSLKDVGVGTLWLIGTRVKDLSPLAGKSLVSLDVQGTSVSDLSPLSGMTSLKRLNIVDTSVTDLSPLSRLALERVLLTPSKIETGWDALRRMPSLTTIDVASLEDIQQTGRQPTSAAEFWRRLDAGEF